PDRRPSRVADRLGKLEPLHPSARELRRVSQRRRGVKQRRVMPEAEETAGAPPLPNILIVDDDPAKLIALRAVLAPLGANLVEARSGADALRHLLKDDFRSEEHTSELQS